MKMMPVDSSNLAAVGYDKKSQTLRIRFGHGGLYEYYNVSEDEYEGLMNAPSHGRYFNFNIKGSYEWSEL